MKYFIISFLVFFILTLRVTAQKTIIELSYSPDVNQHAFFKGEGIFSPSTGYIRRLPGYKIGISKQIHKELYIKTELGYSAMQTIINKEYTNEDGFQRTVYRKLYADQYSISILPEIRVFARQFTVYANAGVSILSTIRPTFQYEPYEGYATTFSGTNLGLLATTGVGYAYRSVGICASAGGNYFFARKEAGVFPGLGYLQIPYTISFIYQL